MRVRPVSTAFDKVDLTEDEVEKEEGIMCKNENNQRLFIKKDGTDPFYCDKKKHCPKKGLDEQHCGILTDLTFEQPMFSSAGALGLGILLFFVFRKPLAWRPQRKRRRKICPRLRRTIDQIVDQARVLGESLGACK